MNEKHYLKNYNIHDYDVPLCTVDMAIFAIIDDMLSILLVKREEYPFKDQWALPGGFIDLKKDQSISDAAYRKLLEKTGVSSAYLEQVESIGASKRDPRGWALTVLYYALVDASKLGKNGELNKSSEWSPVKKLKKNKLAFDHNTLVDKALNRLQAKASYTALPIELMPDTFTLTELQNVFTIILDRKLQAKSFRLRLMSAGMVEETGESKISGKRPAKLYKATGKVRETYFPRPLSD